MVAQPPPLRFITCGSVDDGKSTLIGRLLLDSQCVFDDQLAALVADSATYGTQGERPDPALLLDGLQAEREQGITIDVAHRYFASATRSFIVADCPGHEQYTRNMATAASTAQLAVVLVDARKGLAAQTRRHARIVAMMGIRQVVLAITKMDQVGYAEAEYLHIARAFDALATGLDFASVTTIPVSGLHGDNVVAGSSHMPWYHGPSLLICLDAAPVSGDDFTAATGAMRLPVQLVWRPEPGLRAYAGRLAAGRVCVGDSLRVLPGGTVVAVKSIHVGFEQVGEAHAGDSVMLTLADEVDVSRGDVLVAAVDPPEIADQFEARLLWFDEQPLHSGRHYLCKIGTRECTAAITQIKYREDIDSGAQLAARTLARNDMARVTLSLGQPVPFEPYARNRTLGAFILIDKFGGGTLGAGMIDFALRRASNIHWQAVTVNRQARARSLGQAPRCVWFTGLSGSGKSTIANLLEQRLHAEGRHTYLLDGDNLRHGLNRDLGFTAADRVENIRRVAEVARLMVDAGLIVLVSFISPFRSERRMARELFADGEFIEVFVDTPLAVCEQRDSKGLYAKARRGELHNLTGIDSPYEVPAHPEIHLDGVALDAAAAAHAVFKALD